MRPVLSTILATSVLTGGLVLASMAGAQSQSQPPSQSQEKCYGVALAGADDGIGLEAVAGQSKVNYQGNAWVWVERGSCVTKALPVQQDGTPRRGALEPLARDRPAG